MKVCISEVAGRTVCDGGASGFPEPIPGRRSIQFPTCSTAGNTTGAKEDYGQDRDCRCKYAAQMGPVPQWTPLVKRNSHTIFR